MGVAVRATHPLKTSEFLVGVGFVVVLLSATLLLFFLLFLFCSFGSLTSSLGRLFSLRHFLAFSRALVSNLLRLTVTADVSNSLQFLLPGELFSLLFFLL